jgi:hypothetical protein
MNLFYLICFKIINISKLTLAFIQIVYLGGLIHLFLQKKDEDLLFVFSYIICCLQ